MNVKGNSQDYKELDDGNTYLKCEIEEELTPKVLFWLNENDMKKWYHKMRRHVKRIPDENEVEIEYIDLDQVLSNYMEEYVNKKQKNQKTITKHFVKFFQEQEGIFNTDEIRTVCSHVIPKENTVSSFVKYPDEISFLRAFLFALTTQNNSFDISNKNFQKGVSKFGIDSPYPCIAKKLYLYGNDFNIAEMIKDKINSLEEANQMVLAHQTNVVGTNVVQRQQQNKNVVIGIHNMKMLDAKKRQTKSMVKGAPKTKGSSVKFNVLNPQNDTQNKDAGNTSGMGMSSVMSGGRRDSTTPSKNVRVVVPSFSTCSALFSQHFSILRELKKKIQKYKNMYEEQRDEENSWNCLENVMKVLDTALAFLNSPIQS